MAKKQTLLKWTKENERELKKAVNEFNKKVRKLKQTRKDKSFIPSEIDYEASKDLITTKAELNRILESLGRFKGKEAFKKVTLPSGDSLTNWELQELRLQQRQAERRIKKRMAEIKRDNPAYFAKSMTRMGNEEYRRLESTLKAIQNFETRKKPSKTTSRKRKKELFEEAKLRIENWGSADFEVRRAIIYRENYFTMLQKTYSNLEHYKELVDYLKTIENPIQFYETIKELESGGKFKDITYMYDATPYQQTLNKYVSELQLSDLIEEDEISEEGE